MPTSYIIIPVESPREDIELLEELVIERPFDQPETASRIPEPSRDESVIEPTVVDFTI